jgi:tRNA nucleotidyltransferase (CCA-adding enzyme)
MEVLVFLYITGDKNIRGKIWEYIFKISKIKPFVTGRDLIERGYKPGCEFRKILTGLLYRQLDFEGLTREKLLEEIE